MKNFLMLLGIFAFLAQPVWAKTIMVQAMEDFSTAQPKEFYSVKLVHDFELSDSITLKEGDILKGRVIDVVSPRRLKRNAKFTFIPETIHTAEGQNVQITEYYPAKYTTVFDKKGLAKNAALSVGNYFVKGVSLGYNAIEGVVKNEKDNRFKSCIYQVYEGSPLSYVEKGGDIVIKTGDNFLLNIKTKEQDNLSDEDNSEQ